MNTNKVMTQDDSGKFVNIVAQYDEPYVAQAIDEKQNVRYVCSICGVDISIHQETDGPDDYTTHAYCEEHGELSK